MGQTCLSLNLFLVVYIEEDSPSAFSFSRSRKINLHLIEDPVGKNKLNKRMVMLFYLITAGKEGPQQTSIYNFIKLSFREGFSSDVIGILNNAIQKKTWENQIQTVSKNAPQIKLRTGIVGIERSLQEKQKATDESISVAFQDLNKLMGMAKEMVTLSKMISTKIKVRIVT